MLYLRTESGERDLFPSAVTLTAQVLGADNVPLQGDSSRVEWFSLEPAIATVDAAGRVQAMAVGRTDVISRSVAEPTLSATVSVTVLDAGVAEVVVR